MMHWFNFSNIYGYKQENKLMIYLFTTNCIHDKRWKIFPSTSSELMDVLSYHQDGVVKESFEDRKIMMWQLLRKN